MAAFGSGCPRRMTSISLFQRDAATPDWRETLIALAVFVGVCCCAIAYPSIAFTIDEVVYIDMARAMAELGRLDVGPWNVPDGAPLLVKSSGFVEIVNGRAIPQYPSLYAVIAGPFYKLMGVKGLALLNALSAVCVLSLTWRVARLLDADPLTARAALALTALVSIFPGYAFAVWPHMLALAFGMLGAYGAALAASGRGPIGLVWAFAGGLAFGLGCGVRVDVILLAIAAFLWLRLFARPRDRGPALALAAGLAPGLGVCAYLNQLKFGVPSPFFYGVDGGGASTANYGAPLYIVGAALIASLAINTEATAFRAGLGRIRRLRPPAMIAVVCAIGLALLTLAPGAVHGAYVLLIDLQAYQGSFQIGMRRDAYGFLSFWDLPKKSLLQSAPYLPLIAIPVVAFFAGRRTRAASFCLLFAAAPVAFFSLKAWHGGTAFNLRYFLPATPFLAILVGMALASLRSTFTEKKDLYIRASFAGIFIAYGLYWVAASAFPAWATPLELYPQLLLAAALLIFLIDGFLWRGGALSRSVATALAAVAIGYGLLLNASDAAGYIGARINKSVYERFYASIIPPGSLVLTRAEEFLVQASLKGAHIARVDAFQRDAIDRAIVAYQAAGDCVFVHTPTSLAYFNAAEFEALAGPRSEDAAKLTLYARRDNPAHCPSASS